MPDSENLLKINTLEKISLAALLTSGFAIPIQLAIKSEKARKAIIEKCLNAYDENKFHAIKKIVYQDNNIKIYHDVLYLLKKSKKDELINLFRKIFDNNILATFAIFFISAYIFNLIQNKRFSAIKDQKLEAESELIREKTLKSKHKKNYQTINYLLKLIKLK